MIRFRDMLLVLAVFLVLMGGVTVMVAWRSYEIGYADASILEADLFCKETPFENIRIQPIFKRP